MTGAREKVVRDHPIDPPPGLKKPAQVPNEGRRVTRNIDQRPDGFFLSELLKRPRAEALPRRIHNRCPGSPVKLGQDFLEKVLSLPLFKEDIGKVVIL